MVFIPFSLKGFSRVIFLELPGHVKESPNLNISSYCRVLTLLLERAWDRYQRVRKMCPGSFLRVTAGTVGGSHHLLLDVAAAL